MQIERRALYNLLRMNWQRDPTMPVESWQVADYRSLSVQTLFDNLRDLEICLDRVSFLALAESVDTPEDLTDDLLADADIEVAKQDQIYLLVFELWRRLVPEKQNLSIFCDELDHQIDLHDRELADGADSIQDVLANFEVILDENTDEVGDPRKVFTSITQGCAHDVEAFLFDFIADQIDNKNESYAAELLEDFSPYVLDRKWFDLLQARLVAFSDMPKSDKLMKQIALEASTHPDLEFNLEVLASLAQGGKPDTFRFFVKQSLPLLKEEEEFQDLLAICADNFHFLDLDESENAVQKIIKLRSQIPLEHPIDQKDPHIAQLLTVFS